MANAGSIGVIEIVEDFRNDNINTGQANGVGWVTSADGGDTAFVRAVNAARGLHLAGAISAADNQMIELCHDLLFIYGQTGKSVLEVLFQVDDPTNLAFNIGFNDESLDSGNTLPIELSGTTWTSTAADFVGLVYDVDATNDEMHCFWVDDGSDASETIADLRMRGAALAASKWAMARVEIQDRGTGKGVRATFNFTQDGKSFEKVFDTTLDRDVALCPYIAFETRDAVVRNIYIKYVKITQTIAD